MRALPTLLAVVLATAPAAGCVSGSKGSVLLHLDERTADSLLAPTYGSSTAAVAPAASELLFLATSSEGILHVALARPIHTGETILLPANEERVHFQLGDAEWVNQGGAVYVISVDPPDLGGAIIGLVGVPMTARSSAATGAFVFNGNGTFACPDADDPPCADVGK